MEATRETTMDLDQAHALVDAHGAERITTALAPFLTDARRSRIETVLAGRMQSVHVAVEAPSDPHNAAAIVRTAEALGAMGVHVIAAEGRALHARATTQGAFHWVQTWHHADLAAFWAAQRARGAVVAGAAMDGSLPLDRLPIDGPLCLLLGNEQRGLSAAARRACDRLFHVPMVGMSESLNLSVTAAIALFDVMRRKRAQGPQGDLDDDARARLRAAYYACSVDPRHVRALWGRDARSGDRSPTGSKAAPTGTNTRATVSHAPSQEVHDG